MGIRQILFGHGGNSARVAIPADIAEHADVVKAREAAAKKVGDARVSATVKDIERTATEEAKVIAKGKGLGHAIKEHGIIRGPLKALSRNAKVVAIGAGVLAALGAAAYMVRGQAEKRTRMDIADAAMVAPQVMDPMVGQPTLMGEVPTPGDRAAAVMAGRGQAAGQGIGA